MTLPNIECATAADPVVATLRLKWLVKNAQRAVGGQCLTILAIPTSTEVVIILHSDIVSELNFARLVDFHQPIWMLGVLPSLPNPPI